MIPSTKVVPMLLLKYKTIVVKFSSKPEKYYRSTTEANLSITYVYGHWLHVYCGTTKLY